MDQRRRQRESERQGRQPPTDAAQPRGATDNAAILAKLDAVLAEQHELRRLVHRLAIPVEVVNIAEAARRLSRSKATMELLAARRIFSDGRPPEKRVRGADLVFFADEIDVYRLEGAKGVARLREELGRG